MGSTLSTTVVLVVDKRRRTRSHNQLQPPVVQPTERSQAGWVRWTISTRSGDFWCERGGEGGHVAVGAAMLPFVLKPTTKLRNNNISVHLH